MLVPLALAFTYMWHRRRHINIQTTNLVNNYNCIHTGSAFLSFVLTRFLAMEGDLAAARTGKEGVPHLDHD